MQLKPDDIWAKSARLSTKMMQLVKTGILDPSEGAYIIDSNVVPLELVNSDIEALSFGRRKK
jgi:hypothetical protein